jgi:hypothetical protein
VIEWPNNFPRTRNEFIAQLDNEPNWQTRISIKRQKIQKLPIPPTPEWVPPLCLKDASELDRAIVQFCEKSYWHSKWKINWNSFNEIIRTVWHYRLPVEPNELWGVLQAHGVPLRSKRRLIEFYTKGRNLLIWSVGKKPIKKKRVKPLSI